MTTGNEGQTPILFSGLELLEYIFADHKLDHGHRFTIDVFVFDAYPAKSSAQSPLGWRVRIKRRASGVECVVNSSANQRRADSLAAQVFLNEHSTLPVIFISLCGRFSQLDRCCAQQLIARGQRNCR